MQDFRKIVDDVIVFNSNEGEHVSHSRAFLQRCQERRISLNPDKFQFSQQKVSFAGYTVKPEGYTISSYITDAVSKFPTPSSMSDLRSFLGLTNQLSSSTNNLAETLSCIMVNILGHPIVCPLSSAWLQTSSDLGLRLYIHHIPVAVGRKIRVA